MPVPCHFEATAMALPLNIKIMTFWMSIVAPLLGREFLPYCSGFFLPLIGQKDTVALL